MDFIKSQFDRIVQQLNGLNSTQKMLTAALVGLMVMTLLFWGKYAGDPEMQPVLDQAFSDEDLTRITAQLAGKGITYEVSGDKKILVPVDRKIEILSMLGYAEMLPRDMTNGFDAMIKQVTMWDGKDRQDKVFNRGKEITLSQVIGNFPGVQRATVVIDPRTERRIGISIGSGIEATAFVSIEMKGGQKAGKQLINAAANVVAGAQAGLALKNVRVVVDGVPHHVHDPSADDALAGVGGESIFEHRQRVEAWLSDKVRKIYAEIPGVLVAVSVDVDHRTATQRERIMDAANTLQKEKRVESTNRESTMPAPVAADPGAGSNLAIGISGAPAAPSGGTDTQSTEKIDYETLPSFKEIDSRIPAGAVTTTGASVRVPRSHFVAIAKQMNGKDPDEAAITAVMTSMLAKIQSLVATSISLKPEAVQVDAYFDAVPATPPSTEVATASTFSLGVLGGHTKEIVLGGLALLSLFMVSMMVRKSGPAPIAVATVPATPVPTPLLVNNESIAGEASESGVLLDGLELDDDAIQTQQIFTQVSSMVEENPDAAASLMKRWLNKG